jgi:alkaline phosphatase
MTRRGNPPGFLFVSGRGSSLLLSVHLKTRRSFLQSLAAAPVLGGACATRPATPARVRPASIPAGVPRNIIHLVVDGLGSGMLACSNHYSRLTRHRPLTWIELLRRPDLRTALMDVRSQSSVVTDSSASSSAWGSGVRIPNGKVNQTSDGRKLVTLYELLATAGWKRGLVTTTEITHATPAGFATCAKSRAEGDELALQYLDRGVEVMLGGGRKFFGADTRKDKRDLKGEFRRRGYALLEKPTDLASAPLEAPWLGLFAASHLPFVLDQQGGISKVEEVPSLAAMTRAALRRLGTAERFVLQVEGGRVDHGAHNDDAAAAIREMIGFDEAIDVCLEYQREHPETLLIMTTDHATGNPGLNGMGDNYDKSNLYFRNLLSIRQSIPELGKRLLLTENPEQFAQKLYESTGYVLSTRRRELLEPFLKKKGYALFDGVASDVGAMGQVLANHTGISFTSTQHTSDYVPLLALGPGAEAFAGFIDNTQVFEHYVDFAGLKFRNRQEPLIADGGVVREPGTPECLEEYLLG